MARRWWLRLARTGLVSLGLGLALADIASRTYFVQLRSRSNSAVVVNGRLRLSTFDPLEVRVLSTEEFAAHDFDPSKPPAAIRFGRSKNHLDSAAFIGPSAMSGVGMVGNATDLVQSARAGVNGAILMTTLNIRLRWLWLACAGAGGALMFIRTRHPLGHCPTCGYDRRSTPDDAPCPECGSASTPARAASENEID